MTEQKDEKAILNVLDKIGKKSPAKNQPSINLAKKHSAPVGGFSENLQPEAKKQKVEKVTGWNEEEEEDNGMCINCGS